MSKILITPKINPDLDGVACAYGYTEFLNSLDNGNEYVAGVYGEPQSEAVFLLERFNINNGLIFNPDQNFDKFIIVDASDTKGMPAVIRPEDVIGVIDHRTTHQAGELFPRADIQIELVGAAATLIWEKFINSNITPSFKASVLLFGAIYSNTLNLSSELTVERDLKAVKVLSSTMPANLISDMFAYKAEQIALNLENTIINDFKVFNGGLGIAQLESFDLAVIVESRLIEIKDILKNLKKDHSFNHIFLTAADIKNAYNIFVVIDDATQSLLAEKLELVFDDRGVAKNNKLMLRKQILPLLK